jgi:hypothetical protein
MKKQIFITIFSVFIFSVQDSFAQNDNCLDKFSWLKGTWKMQDKESAVVEEWSLEPLTAMKGKSYEVRLGDTTITENATITCIGGEHVFTFHPILKDLGDARQPVNFVLISEENNTFVFENKEHDFPQRVVYQNVSPNECHAWIEGEEKGKMNKVDFFYKRVK